MKQLLLLFFVFLGACSTAVTESIATVQGVWTWENVRVDVSPAVLEKHVLTLHENTYEEAFFKNDVPRSQGEGTFLMSRNGANIEFSLIGNIQTVYKGTISGNQLMILSTNSHQLTPPALYRR